MALTEQEKQKVKELKAKGYDAKKIASYIGGERTNKTSSIAIQESIRETPIEKNKQLEQASTGSSTKGIVGINAPSFGQAKETLGDVVQTGKGIFNQFKSAGEDIVDVATNKDLSLGEKVRGGVSRAFSGASRAMIEEPVKGIVKAVLPQEGEDKLKAGIQTFGKAVVETDTAKKLGNWWANLDSDSQREYTNALQFGEGLLDLLGIGAASKVTKSGLSKIDYFVKQVDGVVKQENIPVAQAVQKVEKPKLTPADFTDAKLREQAQIRMKAEAQAPELTIPERMVGLNQADKAQIVGKTNKMADYINVAKTRNVKADAPTVMEFGGDQVRKAAETMEQVLNNKGSVIGATRNKLSTVKAPIEKVQLIQNTFIKELDNLGLTIKNGQVVRKAGVVSRVGTNSDITALQSLWDEFKIVKQSPTLTNLLDYRNLVQKNIDFGKSAREVSDALNVPSSKIRRQIKEVADSIVGKGGAKDLQDYSDFIQALNDIKSFTDRKAGGEYLLRVLESGRGGEARQVINTIKKHTGIDLQDDATIMKLVTDMIGNADQKTLFRKEITNAGIDAARIVSGDASTIFQRGAEFIMDKLTDAEEVLIDATRSFNKGATPSSGANSGILKKILGSDIPNKQGGFAKIGRDTKKGVTPESVGNKMSFEDREIANRILQRDTLGTDFATEDFKVQIGIDKLSEKDQKAFLKEALEISTEKAKGFTGTQPEKTVPKSKVNESVSSLNDTTLIKEAKKYKSADEFVKAQEKDGQKFYHGTNANIGTNNLKPSAIGVLGDGVYLTPNKKTAATYGKNVLETSLPKLKLLKLSSKEADSIAKKNKTYVFPVEEKFEKALLNEGYDGIIDSKGNVAVKSQQAINQIKTKSQLTDIWNKANKK